MKMHYAHLGQSRCGQGVDTTDVWADVTCGRCLWIRKADEARAEVGVVHLYEPATARTVCGSPGARRTREYDRVTCVSCRRVADAEDYRLRDGPAKAVARRDAKALQATLRHRTGIAYGKGMK